MSKFQPGDLVEIFNYGTNDDGVQGTYQNYGGGHPDIGNIIVTNTANSPWSIGFPRSMYHVNMRLVETPEMYIKEDWS